MRQTILDILTRTLKDIESDEHTIVPFEFGDNKSILFWGEKWNVKITLNKTYGSCALAIKDSKKSTSEENLVFEIFYINKIEWKKFLGIPLFKRTVFDSSDEIVILFDKLYDMLYDRERKVVYERRQRLDQIKKDKQAKAIEEVIQLKI